MSFHWRTHCMEENKWPYLQKWVRHELRYLELLQDIAFPLDMRCILSASVTHPLVCFLSRNDAIVLSYDMRKSFAGHLPFYRLKIVFLEQIVDQEVTSHQLFALEHRIFIRVGLCIVEMIFPRLCVPWHVSPQRCMVLNQLGWIFQAWYLSQGSVAPVILFSFASQKFVLCQKFVLHFKHGRKDRFINSRELECWIASSRTAWRSNFNNGEMADMHSSKAADDSFRRLACQSALISTFSLCCMILPTNLFQWKNQLGHTLWIV